MTGQGLYAQWMAANGEANTHVDGWELLEETDHQIWEAFARRLNRYTGRVDLQLSASLTASIINSLQEVWLALHPEGRPRAIDDAIINVRALRSVLLLKQTQNENAVYRGSNDIGDHP